MRKPKIKLKKQLVPFQSDIVIDEEGDIHVSFLGAELLTNPTLKNSIDRKDYTPISISPLSESGAKEIEQEYRECKLCPHKCGFNRLDKIHPRCGDWHLRVANVGLSFGDEPEISSGGGSGIIFLSGCSLTCPSCINKEKVQNPGTKTSTEEFIQMAEKLYLEGANNIQILSPTVHMPQLRVALQALKDGNFPIPIILKSSGFESVAEIKKLDGLIDIYFPDFKFINNEFWLKRSGAKDYYPHFQDTLKEMFRQTGESKFENDLLQSGVMVRHIKNPYLTATQQDLILKTLNELSSGIHISILDNFVVLD